MALIAGICAHLTRTARDFGKNGRECQPWFRDCMSSKDVYLFTERVLEHRAGVIDACEDEYYRR